jgi:hypothetical protein
MRDYNTTQPISCPTCGATCGRDCTCTDHILNHLPPATPPRPMRVYRSSFWGRFLIWLGLGILSAAMLTGCGTSDLKRVSDAATKPNCLKGTHVVTEPARTDKFGRKHERIRYCEQDAEPVIQRASGRHGHPITRPKRNLSGIVEDARIASGLSCAGIDNHRNEAAWSDGHSSVVSTYTDNGDQLRYAHPAPSGRTLEALKRAEDALGIGRAGRKVIIACT